MRSIAYMGSEIAIMTIVPLRLPERRGEPAVVIMSVQDFIRAAAQLAAEGLGRSQGARPRGLATGGDRGRNHRSPPQQEGIRLP